MEITLRKPQRELFKSMRQHPGSFLRLSKKSFTGRERWRLMTKDFSPVKNFPLGVVKPMTQRGLLEQKSDGGLILKDDLVLVEKTKK